MSEVEEFAALVEDRVAFSIPGVTSVLEVEETAVSKKFHVMTEREGVSFIVEITSVG